MQHRHSPESLGDELSASALQLYLLREKVLPTLYVFSLYPDSKMGAAPSFHSVFDVSVSSCLQLYDAVV